MKCPNCQTENPADATLCRECGQLLTREVTPPPEPVEASQEIPENPIEKTNSGSRRRLVRKILAGLLVLLFLVIGAGIGGFFYQRFNEDKHLQRAVQLAEQGQWGEAIDAYTAALSVWPAAARRHDAESVLGRGESYLRAGQYASAIADLDAALGHDPDQLRAYQLRGEARLAQAEYQGALAEFNQCIALDRTAAELYLKRAEVRFRHNDFAQAAADADKAVELDGTLLSAHLLSSAGHFYLREYEASRTAAAHAIELAPDSALAHAYQGAALLGLNEDGEALAALDRAVELDPNLAAAYAFRTEAYLRQDNDAAALTNADQAIALGGETDPAVALAYAWRAVARSNQDSDAAQADADKAVALNPHLPPVYLAWANLHLRQENHEAALADVYVALALAPDWVTGYGLRAAAYSALDDLERALADVNRAIELDPEYAQAYARRARIYALQGGRHQLALADVDRAIELDPEEAFYYMIRAYICFQQDDYDQALADYDRAIELESDNVTACGAMVDIYIAQEEYDQALTTANRFVELASNETDETLATACATRGRVNLLLDDYEAAFPDLDKAIELDPELAWAYGMRGYLHLLDDNLEEAIADLSRALELDPDWTDAYVWRAEAYSQSGEVASAVRDCTIALDWDPALKDAYRTRALAYLALGDSLSALMDYSRMIELDPNDAYAYASRAETLVYQGELERALADANKAIELAPEAVDGYASRALVGEYELAIADYDRAIELDPDFVSAYFNRAICYLSLDEIEPAVADLETALALADTVDDIAFIEQEIVRLTQPPPTPAPPAPTPTIPMALYESAQYPFAIQYPAQWAEQPEQEGITVLYAEDSAMFGIAEEDLIAGGAEEMTLEEYADVVLFVVAQGFEDFELVSRQRTVNAQGLPVQIVVFTAGPGGVLKASRLIYLHENKIGFNASYFALKARHQELEPLIEFSFSTFRVREPGQDFQAVVAPTASPTPSTPLGMVYVPAGELIMGSSDDEVDYALALCNEYWGDCKRTLFENEQPQHAVYLDAFHIDKTEATNAQYRACVEAEVCDAPSDTTYYDDANYVQDPVVYVSWNDADAYCRWAGKRLPTAAEWEKAARGTDGRVYPWEDTFDGNKLNFCDKNCPYDWGDASIDDGYADTAPVGSYPAGASPYGALDMAGNVWEWVADWYGRNYYSQSPGRNPPGPDSGEERVVRGGSWSRDPASVRGAVRYRYPPDDTRKNVGFRCARGSE
jgi:tetratricopeptide (TPR) repeat protein/formylglycine-generating enzyme required for sulfatase activity